MFLVVFALGFACGAMVVKHWDWIVKNTTTKGGK